MMSDFDIDNHPERYEWFPVEPEQCIFCPWWSANPRSPLQCQGDE